MVAMLGFDWTLLGIVFAEVIIVEPLLSITIRESVVPDSRKFCILERTLKIRQEPN